jgi:hypothetical protein
MASDCGLGSWSEGKEEFLTEFGQMCNKCKGAVVIGVILISSGVWKIRINLMFYLDGVTPLIPLYKLVD